ncbi:glycine zipper 2TM domain-containing protein [Pyruvatibacter mobilis]|uniref:glycine zipper 2TM domain-containing protein n=1 Tax=Pyruvatibacter mobilis TaxID=1712261 RepID=UPI003D0E50E7
MRHIKLAAIIAGALALGACQTYGSNGYGPKTVGGAVIGGVAGGLLGSQFGSGSGQLIATGVGTLLGAAVGGSAGQSLDRADALYAERAYSDSIYSQGPVHWRNPRSGHHGQFEAGPAYNHGGRQCKQIESTFYGPNGPYQNYATACRMPDGSWRTI